MSEDLWHSPESNFTVSGQVTILYNELKNYTFKIILRGQWVKWDGYHTDYFTITGDVVVGCQNITCKLKFKFFSGMNYIFLIVQP